MQLVDKKFTMSYQCVTGDNKANGILGTIKSMSSRLREVHILFYSALVRSYLKYCIQFRLVQLKRERKLLETVQWRTMRMIKGLEQLSHKERLR